MIKAFLEKCGNEWFDDFVYTAVQPLTARGFKIVQFDGTFLDDFIERTSFGPDDIIVGSVEATAAFWRAIGFQVPGYLGYPTFSGMDPYQREIWVSKYKDLDECTFPVFVKPKDQVKLFTGMVLNTVQSYRLAKNLYGIDPELEVYVSDPIDVLSEYRCFVHKGELVGMKHYDGDFMLFPDVELVKNMVLAYEDAPVSYTLDVGVCGDATTRLIEVNDFWAIGGYGLDGKTYVRMLIDRFQEIKKLNSQPC
jgi:hypothetical protein